MTQTTRTSWRQVSNGDTTTETVSGDSDGQIAVQSAQIRWRGVDDTNSYTDYKYYGPNSGTLENPLGDIEVLSNTVNESGSSTDVDAVGNALPNLPSNSEFESHQIEHKVDTPSESDDANNTISDASSVSFDSGTLTPSGYYNSELFIATNIDVYVEPTEDHTVEVNVSWLSDNIQKSITTGSATLITEVTDANANGTTYSANIVSDTTKVDYIELRVKESWHKQMEDIVYETYGSSDPVPWDTRQELPIPADGRVHELHTQLLTSYIADGEGTDDTFVQGGVVEGTTIGGDGFIIFRTYYKDYTSESITVSSPTIQDSSYSHDATEWFITVSDGTIVYQRSGDSGSWDDPQTTSTNVNGITYFADGDDLVLETAEGTGKVTATGEVEVRAEDTKYTTVDTEDPSVSGDVSASYVGVLDDGETSPWRSIDALSAGENTLNHSIPNGSNKAEYQIEYEYVYVDPEPTYGTVSVYEPSTGVWHEVAVMDESDPAVVRDALRLYDGTAWRPVDTVPADHPDALTFTRHWSGSEWLALRSYNTTVG